MAQTIESVKPSLKIPPHSLEAEQAVLGGLMLDNSAWEQIADRIGEQDFYRQDHRLIFRAITSLTLQHKPLDIITISERLELEQELDAAGGLSYLGQLAKNTPSAANITAYADIVRERSLLRQLIEVGGSIVGSAFEPKGRTAGELVDEAERKVFAIAERGDAGHQEGPQSIAEVLAKTVDRIEHLFESDSSITGISSGFADLDKLTSGLQQSDLVIVAGRPSMGKTTFAMNIAEYVGMKSNKPVLIFSMEMPSEQLAMRMLSSLGRIEMQRIRTGQLDDGDWPRLSSAIAMMSEKKIFIDDTGALSPSDVRARARRVMRDHGELGLIVLDYLQLMKVPGNNEHRAAEISEISRSLKSLARELNIPIIALSQLNRSLEQRTDRRPMMSDLRECVVGNTLVNLSDGRRVPIQDLVGKNVDLVCMNEQGKLVNAKSELIWYVGDKQTYTVHLASGRKISATAEHRLYAFEGWKTLEALSIGDNLAIARSVGPKIAKAKELKEILAKTKANTNVDVVPEKVFEQVKMIMKDKNITHRQMANLRGTSYGGQAHFTFAPSRDVLLEYAELLEDESLRNLAQNDLFWDRIVAITDNGVQPVYDLTVPTYANWLADGIVSHNSGALEQDADLIVFIYRDEVYNKDSPAKGSAEIIIAKQRNGPIGTVRLTFLGHYSRFENFANRQVGAESPEYEPMG